MKGSFRSFVYNTIHFNPKRRIARLVGKMNLGKENNIEIVRMDSPYILAEAVDDGQVFLFNNRDKVISGYTLRNNRTWAWDEMEFFLNHMKPDNDKKGGIFLDIGANVGTTSIYISKKLGKDCLVYAFEPIRLNYKLLKVNCILNDVENIVAENIGISDCNEDMIMKTDSENMASSRIDNNILEEYKTNYSGTEEKATFITLDDYTRRNAIDLSEIRGIWIDTEGHEASVIAGGLDVFRNCDAPVYLEFNPRVYRNNGQYDEMIKQLMSIYNGFLCWEDYSKGKKVIRSISELPLVEKEMDSVFCNLLLIKGDHIG